MSHGNDDSPANCLIKTYYDYNLFVGYNPYASVQFGILAESYILLQQLWSFFSLLHSKASMKTNDVNLGTIYCWTATNSIWQKCETVKTIVQRGEWDLGNIN